MPASDTAVAHRRGMMTGRACMHAGHVNTMEGLGSFLRSWLRPPRQVLPRPLPLSVGCCACVHHVKRCRKALAEALREIVLTPLPATQRTLTHCARPGLYGAP